MTSELQHTNGFAPEVLEKLGEPLNASFIKDRKGGGGRRLKYITGKTAIDAANRIFGPGQWGYKVINRTHETCGDEKKGMMEYYTADIELYVVGAAFPFPGDGVGIVTAPYTVEIHEKARKEAVTDALKRALRHYGDQFGLALYDEDAYVEDNGVMVQVKTVNPQNNDTAKRVVEASQPVKRIAPVAASTPARTTDEKEHIPTEKELIDAMKQAGYSSMKPAIEGLCVGTDKDPERLLRYYNAHGFTPDLASFLYNRLQEKTAQTA
jgi:recombination DNA repair RAD52 pathway protein